MPHIDAFRQAGRTGREDHVGDLVGIGEDRLAERLRIVARRVDRHRRDSRADACAVGRQRGDDVGGRENLGAPRIRLVESDWHIGPPGGEDPEHGQDLVGPLG